MGGDAHFIQACEDKLGDTVIEHALAVDHFHFLGVEGGGVVLVMDDERAGFGAFIEDLGLALVNPRAARVHGPFPHYEITGPESVAIASDTRPSHLVRTTAGDGHSDLNPYTICRSLMAKNTPARVDLEQAEGYLWG